MTDAPKRPRAWQRMLSGRRLDLLDPRPSDIEIEDIALGLARVARWNGQTVGQYSFSVAQHALLVDVIAASVNRDWSTEARLAALLHDAPEYVIGDLISPFKAAVGIDYKAFEVKLLGAVHERFRLPVVLPKPTSETIKAADRIAAYFEATRLAGFSLEEGAAFFGEPAAIPRRIVSTVEACLVPLAPAEARALFLERFHELSGAAPPVERPDPIETTS